MACVAADGTLAGLPRAYRDPYTNGVPEEFFRKIPRQEVYRRTGIQIMNFNSLFQLRAARGEGMSALENAASVLFMPDALSYLLTGEKVCEYTILSTSQFMDPRTREIDGALLREAGVDPALFPRVVMPGQRIGVLCDAVARQTGLGAVPVVAVAGHDTASAVAAVPARNGRFAYLSSGTWSLMGIEVPEPIITEESYAMNFTNEGGVDGTVRFLKNITGMWLLEQCRAVWSRQGREYSYEEIVRMTEGAALSPGVIDPDAAGVRRADRHAAGDPHVVRGARRPRPGGRCGADAADIRLAGREIRRGARETAAAGAVRNRMPARHRRRRTERPAEPDDGRRCRHPRRGGPCRSHGAGQHHGAGACRGRGLFARRNAALHRPLDRNENISTEKIKLSSL